jgi:hypothetical protein
MSLTLALIDTTPRLVLRNQRRQQGLVKVFGTGTMVLHGNEMTAESRHLVDFHQELLDPDRRHVRVDRFLQADDRGGNSCGIVAL